MRAAKKQDLYDQFIDEFNHGKLRYADLKESTSEALVEIANHLNKNKNELLSDKKALKNIVKASSAEIRKVAQQTLKDVKDLTGLLNVRL